MPLRTPLVVFALGLLALPAAAQTNPYTWNTTAGNWNVAGNWLNGSSTAEVPPSNAATQLVFNASGTSNYTATNDIGPFTLNRLTVNHAGTGTVTITGVAANTFTFAGTNPTIDVTGTALFTGLMAGSAVVTKTGTGTFIHDSNNAGFTGQLVINGGTFLNRSTTVATTNFNPTLVTVNSGGTYQFGLGGAGDPNLPNGTYITVNTGGLVVWQEGETTGGINIQGGTVDLQQGSVTTATNTGSANVMAWASGTLTATQTGSFAIGGTLPINKTTAGTVTITGRASVTTTGAFNIQDGTVAHVAAANLGTSPVTLGNTGGTTAGTFEYQGGSASRTGNFTVNAGGGAVRVTDPLSTLVLTGTLAGAGPLTKSGPGILALTGPLNQTGLTTVADGTLRLNPVASAGGVSVAAAGVLAVNSAAGATTLTVPTLANSGRVRFDLDTAALPTAALVAVGNPDGLTPGGTLALTNLQSFASGTYQLIDYSGTPITSGFNLSLPGRTAASLMYNTTDTRIDLAITGTDTITWGGQTNATWDVGTAANVGGTSNWRLASNNANTNFIDTDTVTFDDTANGFNVNLGVTVQPNAVTVSNSTNTYTIQGAGKISGPTGLVKTGSGVLRLGTDNDYTGGTTVTAGTLQLGAGGTAGSVVGPIALSAGTTLAFDRSTAYTFGNPVGLADGISILQNGTGAVTVSQAVPLAALSVTVGGPGELTFAATVSGTGTVTKVGTGTVNLNANNNAFTGTLVVNGGRVLLQDVAGSGGDLGAALIVVNSGGTFQFGAGLTGENPDMPDTTYFTINGGGEVVFRIGEQFGGINLFGGTLTLNGGSAGGLVGTTPSEWRSGTVNGLTANGVSGTATINKTTAGTVTISGGATVANPLNILEGTVAYATAANLGTNAITLGGAATNGTLEYQGVSASRAGNIPLGDGGGTIRVTNAGATLTLPGTLSGPGTLTKTGPGTLALTGPVSQTGGTVIGEGTLSLAPTATVAAGLTQAAGTTLAVASGAATATTTVPALSLPAGGAAIRFDLATATIPTVSLLTVSGSDALTLGGGTHTLRLTNTQPMQNGTYQLIDYSGTGITAGFGLHLPGRTTGNLVYNTTDTRIDLAVTGSDSVKWGGQVNGTWDTGTAVDIGGTNNWRLVSSSATTNFIDTDAVVFDDSAGGNFTITVPATVLPGSVTANNSANNYTLTGAGGIGGAGGLTKQGTSTLRLETANTYTGATTVTAGTLQLGGASGSVAGTIFVDASGTLAFDRTAPLTYSLPISGTGTINITGTGVVTLDGSNPFTGTVNVTAGATLRVADNGAGGDLNAGAINVNTGGLFQFVGPAGNSDLPGGTVINVNGGTVEFTEGEDYGGFNLRSGGAYNTSVNNNLTIESALESGTIGGIGGVNGSFGSTVLFRKTTFGTVTVTGVAFNHTGGLSIDEGTFSTDSPFVGAGGVISFGATSSVTFQYRGATFNTDRPTSFGEGGGTVDVTQAGTVLTFAGEVSGIGPIVKTGPGVLAVSGTTNSYQGSVAVSAGTVRLANASGSAFGTAAVDVNAGGKLDGTGSHGGSTRLNAGGTLQGGIGGASGTLSLPGGLTLDGTNTVRVVVADTALGNGAADLTSNSLVIGGFARDTGGAADLTTIKLVGSDLTLDAGQSYTVVVATFTSSSGLSAANFTIDPNPEGFQFQGTPSLVFDTTLNQLRVSFVPTPEPATVLGLAAGVLAAGGWLRRRRHVGR